MVSNTALWLQNSNGKGSLSLGWTLKFSSDNAEQWQCCTTPWPADTLILPPHTIGRRSSGRYFSFLRMTRSSADADNRLDAFSGQSRSTNMVPFHMLHIVSYCAIVTLSLRRAVIRYSSSKNFMTLKWGQRSLKVIESDIIR